MTMHLVSAPMVRPRVNVENVNAAGLTLVECCGVDRAGVWFADTLDPADEFKVVEWLSTPNDTVLARRAEYRAIDPKDLLNGFEIARAFALGDPLPQPVYPPPEPEPAPG